MKNCPSLATRAVQSINSSHFSTKDMMYSPRPKHPGFPPLGIAIPVIVAAGEASKAACRLLAKLRQFKRECDTNAGFFASNPAITFNPLDILRRVNF